MPTLFLVHWNKDECDDLADRLRAEGHRVVAHWSTDAAPKPPTTPDAWVISIDRLPSHGRAVAGWIVGAKSRREKPLIFLGGAPEKIAATRARFPNATYAPAARAGAAVRAALANAPDRPAAPRAPGTKPARKAAKPRARARSRRRQSSD